MSVNRPRNRAKKNRTRNKVAKTTTISNERDMINDIRFVVILGNSWGRETPVGDGTIIEQVLERRDSDGFHVFVSQHPRTPFEESDYVDPIFYRSILNGFLSYRENLIDYTFGVTLINGSIITDQRTIVKSNDGST